MKFRFIRQHSTRHRVRTLCRVLGVSPSGYYAWLHRPESQRRREDRRLLHQIRVIHRQSRRSSAAPASTPSFERREFAVAETASHG